MSNLFKSRVAKQLIEKNKRVVASVKENISPKEVVEFLNGLLKIDSEAINKLFTTRVDSKGFGDSTNPVQINKDSKVGIMGILNGMFGMIDSGTKKGYGPIMYEEDDKGKILNFGLTADHIEDKPKEEEKK